MQNKAPAGGKVINGTYYAGGQFVTTRRMADEEAERRRVWEADRRACMFRRIFKDAVNVALIVVIFFLFWIIQQGII